VLRNERFAQPIPLRIGLLIPFVGEQVLLDKPKQGVGAVQAKVKQIRPDYVSHQRQERNSIFYSLWSHEPYIWTETFGNAQE
jgi:hypothetical protein